MSDNLTVSTVNEKGNNSIDFFKFIFAFAVIAIHTNPVVNCSADWFVRFINCLTSLAVPFFFIASGYFLGKKISFSGDDHDIQIIKSYSARILKLYLIWMLFYTPLAIAHYVNEGISFVKALASYAIGAVFIGEQYNNWVLWYLLSTFYASIIVLLIIKKGWGIKGLIFLAIIGIFAVLFFNWFGSYDGSVSWLKPIHNVVVHVFPTGRIFTGMIYIPIGLLLSKRSVPIVYAYIAASICFVLRLFVQNEVLSLFLLIVLSIGLFVLIQRIHMNLSLNYWLLRKMSTGIFLIHLYIWTAYYMIVYGTKTFGLDSFVVVSLISALVSFIYYMFIRKAFKRKSK